VPFRGDTTKEGVNIRMGNEEGTQAKKLQIVRQSEVRGGKKEQDENLMKDSNERRRK